MILTTATAIEGYRIKEVIGLVYGDSLRTRGWWGRLVSQAESIIGGRATAYLHEMEKGRKAAKENLIRNAASMGANAVIGIDTDWAEVLEGFMFVSINGTAVIVEVKEDA